MVYRDDAYGKTSVAMADIESRRSHLLGTSFRQLGRNTRLAVYTIIAKSFAVTGIYNVLFSLFLVRLGYGIEFIGIVNSIASITFAVFALPAGAFGARIGCKRAMLLGCVFYIIGYSVQPLVGLLDGGFNSVLLVGAKTLTGLAMALFVVNGRLYLFAAGGENERSQAFSMQWAVAGVFVLLGSLIGGFLPALFSRILSVTLQQAAPYRFGLFLVPALLLPGFLLSYL